jgi:uncharacterized repeat protein (TIGR01451 family)
VTINPSATGTLSVQANVTETTPEFFTADNSAVLVTAVSGGATAGISITMTGPLSVAAGNSVTYSITVTNIGPATATNVTVTFPAPSGLTFSSASAPCTGGFPCVLGLLPVGPGTSFSATFVVSPSYSSPSIAATATVSATEVDPVPSDNSATVTTTVTAGAIQNFVGVGCTKLGSKRIFTFQWSAYTWSGVDHYRITDESRSPVVTWSSGAGTGSYTSMSIPTSGNLARNPYQSDFYYIEAIDASGNVIAGSKSIPSVQPVCS